MNRRGHIWRVKADDKFKQYFKRWEVFKLYQSRVKEYFDKRKNIIGHKSCTIREQAEQQNVSQEKELFGRLIQPLLENSRQKCGSLEDIVAQKPVVVIEPLSEKRVIDESWKKRIKQYKIDGFLCVPSLYKYDPYEPDLLRTSSDTCVRYGNYESHIPPEKRFWGLSKRSSTFPEKGGNNVMITSGQSWRAQNDEKGSTEPPRAFESSLVHGVQKWNCKKPELQKRIRDVRVFKDETNCQNVRGSEQGANNEPAGSAHTSSSSSIDDSLMKRFTRPVCKPQQQESSYNRNGRMFEAIKCETPSNLNGAETKYIRKDASNCQKSSIQHTDVAKMKRIHGTLATPKASIGRIEAGRRCVKLLSKTNVTQSIQHNLKNAKSAASNGNNNFHGERISCGAREFNAGLINKTARILRMKSYTKPNYVKTADKSKSMAEPLAKYIENRHVSINGGITKDLTRTPVTHAFLSNLQNSKSCRFHGDVRIDHGELHSSRGITSSGGSGHKPSEEETVRTTENKSNHKAESFAIKDMGNQHVSSMCGEWKPNLAPLDASKLSRSIKTSSTNEVSCTPNKNRDFQYQCRRKQSENTGKTPLRVMNYCFEGQVTTPVRAVAASKPENRRLLSADKVCCGRDGVKKKDRQYGSNFSVKASKSHFDLTTQVLLQARGLRK